MSYATFENYNGNSNESTEDGVDFKLMEIQSIQHKNKILEDNKVVAVLIYATWCGPCKVFKPKIREYARLNLNRCYVAQEDIELNLTDGISAVPSIIVYHNSKPVNIIKGGDLKELERIVKELSV
jgi:thiol-disulfide isomerase/thioredoxin